MVIEALGGLALFLIGMVLLTDGLKALAGRALRDLLTRFVSGPISGLLTGAVFTAVVQSSSATTLTTIGFVSAGLITFPQAIGVIFGANIGTTSTGWIVSTLGMKVAFGAMSPILILLGALLRLFTRERLASLGIVIAGFGLIFYGIDVLQAGMVDLASTISSAIGPAEGVGGRLVLVGIGIAMTVAMQSSSAAIAATIVALNAGGIDFPQAAALVIGQNIGTTVTATIAAIGGSVPAKRTAVAHILFNVVTGAIAFAMLPIFTSLAVHFSDQLGEAPGPASIAAFHTVFNVLGVLVLLPVVHPFSKLVMRLVPARGPNLTKHLDPTVAELGSVGMEAARQAETATLRPLIELVRRRLGAPADPELARVELSEIEAAVGEIRSFLDRLSTARQTTEEVDDQLGLLHAVDHLAQLADVCRETIPPPARMRSGHTGEVVIAACEALDTITRSLRDSEPAEVARQCAEATARVAEMRRSERLKVLHAIASSRITAASGGEAIDAIRWIDRAVFHIARCAIHLVPAEAEAGTTNAVSTDGP